MLGRWITHHCDRYIVVDRRIRVIRGDLTLTTWLTSGVIELGLIADLRWIPTCRNLCLEQNFNTLVCRQSADIHHHCAVTWLVARDNVADISSHGAGKERCIAIEGILDPDRGYCPVVTIMHCNAIEQRVPW